MAATSFLRGHPTIWIEGKWVYEDDHADIPANGGKVRPCVKCGNLVALEATEPCLGVLPGVSSACCGHGVREKSYVWFTTGVVLEGFIIKETALGA